MNVVHRIDNKRKNSGLQKERKDKKPIVQSTFEEL